MAKKQVDEQLIDDISDVKEEPKKVKTAKADKAKTGYEKWECKIKDGQPQKMLLIKAGVQISDEEAETLNAGRLTGGNVGNVEMFFKPE